MATVYDEAGDALRSSPLYVNDEAASQLEANATPFDEGARDAVLGRLEDAATPTFVAVLPMSAEEENADNAIRQASGRRGTYLTLFPDTKYLVATDDLPSDDVRAAAGSAFAAANGVEDFLVGFVDRVDEIAAGGSAGADSRSSGDDSGWLPLTILLAAGGGGLLIYRRNKRNRERAALERVRTVLEEDITAYGEELAAADLDVRSTALPDEAHREYSHALDLYDSAKDGAERAESPADLRPVTAALEQGRWLLTCVRARAAGETPPPRRLPCFFDPRHGPSVADVAWTPAGGVTREVPACAADVARLEGGVSPDSRMITVNGERRPYWEAGPDYAPWAGGYYGGFLPGIVMGTLLGASLSDPAHAVGFDGGFDGGGGFGGGFDGGGGFGGGFDGGGGF